MPTQDRNIFKPGSFEYIEATLRANAIGTAFGKDFEWLCKWYLLNSPQYKTLLKHVWLWEEWPDRWGPDTGIDLVAETQDGSLWAIQSKAISPDRSIPKHELDSFFSESSRREFAHRLVIATTNGIGKHAQHTINGQEKDVGLVLRGDLLGTELIWPKRIGGHGRVLTRKKPRPHQQRAIRDVVRQFNHTHRGQLIMACGTGKTLTAMWIAQRLKSKRTLLLVPSLSLISQTLSEWCRNLRQPFDFLVVCSDESITHPSEDAAIRSTSELGIPVTTEVVQIRKFLRKKHERPVVVFCTYQSSERVAASQKANTPRFDLVLADEAHRCTGPAAGVFATVLDGSRIKSKRWLFMTATPRYFSDRIKKRADDLEYELASMDDQIRFGPEFHRLTFDEAIEQDLLTDYQVVVIGVTDDEARHWAEEARLVRSDGFVTNARTLAAQIGLAKAMRKYKLRRIITFHSSVTKAKRFTDDTKDDSLPNVIGRMSSTARPVGKLWARHISGHTPAGRRTTLLKQFGELPKRTRGVLSNCACLGEGVDVPTLDGVAFIDPKRSIVDIIQAVGRVMRKAENKKVGTVIIPIFVNQSENVDQVLSSSAYESVWRVLRALRAHDTRLADELDHLRHELGKSAAYGGRIELPSKIKTDMPSLILKDFEAAFFVRTVEKTTLRHFRPFQEARAFAQSLELNGNSEWQQYCRGELLDKPVKPDDIPTNPHRQYHETGWRGLGDWLGTGTIAPKDRVYQPFRQARAFVHKLGLNSEHEWRKYYRGHLIDKPPKPDDIPTNPNVVYRDVGWQGMGDWLGSGRMADKDRVYRTYELARAFVCTLKLRSNNEWKRYCRGELPKPPKPEDIPRNPDQTYRDSGWFSWGDWLGTATVATRYRKYQPFKRARAFVQALGLKSNKEWRKYYRGVLRGKPPMPDDVPTNPDQMYKDNGWQGWGDWLGTGSIANYDREYRTFEQARAFVHTLGLKSNREWTKYCRNELNGKPQKPDDIPYAPHQKYRDSGWQGMGDWLGTGTKAPKHLKFREFDLARQFVHKLKLKNRDEWRQYCQGNLPHKPPKPSDIPYSPEKTYKNAGWRGLGDWLGTGTIAPRKQEFQSFEEARAFVHSLGLTNQNEWRRYCRGELRDKPPRPKDIPTNPHRTYKKTDWCGIRDWLGT